jgi:hypothetical protein
MSPQLLPKLSDKEKIDVAWQMWRGRARVEQQLEQYCRDALPCGNAAKMREAYIQAIDSAVRVHSI